MKFTEIDHWSSDYNRLPSGGKGALKLERIDATEISVTSNGLEHLGKLKSPSLSHQNTCVACTECSIPNYTGTYGPIQSITLSDCAKNIQMNILQLQMVLMLSGC